MEELLRTVNVILASKGLDPKGFDPALAAINAAGINAFGITVGTKGKRVGTIPCRLPGENSTAAVDIRIQPYRTRECSYAVVNLHSKNAELQPCLLELGTVAFLKRISEDVAFIESCMSKGLNARVDSARQLAGTIVIVPETALSHIRNEVALNASEFLHSLVFIPPPNVPAIAGGLQDEIQSALLPAAIEVERKKAHYSHPEDHLLILDVPALRQEEGRNLGIGKLTDIPRYVRGNTVVLRGLREERSKKRPGDHSPFLFFDGALVDWQAAAEMLGMDDIDFRGLESDAEVLSSEEVLKKSKNVVERIYSLLVNKQGFDAFLETLTTLKEKRDTGDFYLRKIAEFSTYEDYLARVDGEHRDLAEFLYTEFIQSNPFLKKTLEYNSFLEKHENFLKKCTAVKTLGFLCESISAAGIEDKIVRDYHLKMIQWLFSAQFEIVIEVIHSGGGKVYVELDPFWTPFLELGPFEFTELIVNMGFDGIKFKFTSEGALLQIRVAEVLKEHYFGKLCAHIKTLNPDAGLFMEIPAVRSAEVERLLDAINTEHLIDIKPVYSTDQLALLRDARGGVLEINNFGDLRRIYLQQDVPPGMVTAISARALLEGLGSSEPGPRLPAGCEKHLHVFPKFFPVIPPGSKTPPSFGTGYGLGLNLARVLAPGSKELERIIPRASSAYSINIFSPVPPRDITVFEFAAAFRAVQYKNGHRLLSISGEHLFDTGTIAFENTRGMGTPDWAVGHAILAYLKENFTRAPENEKLPWMEEYLGFVTGVAERVIGIEYHALSERFSRARTRERYLKLAVFGVLAGIVPRRVSRAERVEPHNYVYHKRAILTEIAMARSETDLHGNARDLLEEIWEFDQMDSAEKIILAAALVNLHALKTQNPDLALGAELSSLIEASTIAGILDKILVPVNNTGTLPDIARLELDHRGLMRWTASQLFVLFEFIAGNITV